MIVIDYRQLLDKIDNPPYTLYSAGDRAAWLDECITTAHAFEAGPVKHGKWIEKKVCRMKWIPYADDDVNPDDVDIECMTEQKCSYCKRWTIKYTYHIELDYCPLCGARMDGDNE